MLFIQDNNKVLSRSLQRCEILIKALRNIKTGAANFDRTKILAKRSDRISQDRGVVKNVALDAANLVGMQRQQE